MKKLVARIAVTAALLAAPSLVLAGEAPKDGKKPAPEKKGETKKEEKKAPPAGGGW